MERRYVRHSNYPRWNNNVLPVVLYLTLPPINCHQTSSKDSCRKVKTRKQQQRDYDRMKRFNEQKTVCDIFPYSSLDNDEIRSMSSKSVQTQSLKPGRSNNSKLTEMQEENNRLNVLISELTENIRLVTEKVIIIEHEKLHLQCLFAEERDTTNMLENEQIKLMNALSLEKQLHLDVQMEYSNFKEQISQTADKELERCKHIEKEHNQEVNELKSEIKHLKSELSKPRSQPSHNAEYVPLITKNSSQLKTSAHRDMGASARKVSAAANNQPSSTSSGANLVPGCQRCGSIYVESHQPSQCPARNFKCGKCSKKGHHTINCKLVCRGCGARPNACPDPKTCLAIDMNCAYCGVKGHLSHTCLKLRYDELGF